MNKQTTQKLLLIYPVASLLLMVGAVYAFGHMVNFRDNNPHTIVMEHFMITPGLFLSFFLHLFLFVTAFVLYGPIKDKDIAPDTGRRLSLLTLYFL